MSECTLKMFTIKLSGIACCCGTSGEIRPSLLTGYSVISNCISAESENDNALIETRFIIP